MKAITPLRKKSAAFPRDMNNLIGTFQMCSFSNGENYYSCYIHNQNISSDGDIQIRGNHSYQFTDDHVHNVWISNCTITKIPKGITKIFPNMKVFEIRNSKLDKIEKNDLVEYRSLEKFCCIENPITYLPGDLFEGFGNLEWIEFWGNNLQIIEPNILDGLTKLKYVEFSRDHHAKRFSMYPRLSSNASLEEIKNELVRKYPQKLKDVQKLEDLVNQLREENEKLKEDVIKVQGIQLKSELFDDLKKMLQKNEHKDFTINIIGEEFRVHKFLLAARSPVLAKMFLEAPDAENLRLVEISPGTFKIILKYIYTDELPAENQVNFLDLFAAAGRLQIKALQDYAAMKISPRINAHNVLDILELSVKYGHDDLKQKSFEILKKKYAQMPLNDEILMQAEKLKKIIDSLKKKEEAIRKLEEEIKTLVLEE
ncbi:uncharacterized protein [Chironomus tepperi]|uniref:uncharacterized protein n=1 Tax=Chironomus tepperi TaxID=113505 RepID=UPI00391FA7C4